jgi:hypothetical protein
MAQIITFSNKSSRPGARKRTADPLQVRQCASARPSAHE